jgi:hypothetical protein
MMTRRFWMRTTVVVALAAGVAALVAPPRALWAQDPAAQDPIVLYALASGSEEVPAVNTPATAFGRFILSADRTQIFYEIRVSRLTSDTTAMHLHSAERGRGGDVVVPLATPVRGQSVGVANVPPAQLAALLNQGLYLNIHTANNRAGEVRGQVLVAP